MKDDSINLEGKKVIKFLRLLLCPFRLYFSKILYASGQALDCGASVHGYLSLFLGQGYLGKFKSMMIFADFLVST